MDCFPIDLLKNVGARLILEFVIGVNNRQPCRFFTENHHDNFAVGISPRMRQILRMGADNLRLSIQSAQPAGNVP